MLILFYSLVPLFLRSLYVSCSQYYQIYLFSNKHSLISPLYASSFILTSDIYSVILLLTTACFKFDFSISLLILSTWFSSVITYPIILSRFDLGLRFRFLSFLPWFHLIGYRFYLNPFSVFRSIPSFHYYFFGIHWFRVVIYVSLGPLMFILSLI